MKWWLSFFGSLVMASLCLAGQRGLPPREGIGNFGKVSATLYRGAQPDDVGVRHLQKLGVKLIINLRMPSESWKQEEKTARDCGIIFTNVPLKGLGRPADKQILMVLAMIEASTGPVFVHCAHGCDRTGTVVACYRIQHGGWSPEAALREARRYGMSRWERGMRRYVLDFGKASKSSMAQRAISKPVVSF